MVFVLKYRKNLLTTEVFDFIKTICKGIEERYFLRFDAIGSDGDHMHLVVEAAPRYSPSRVMQICKSITAIQIFKQFPQIKNELWGGEFWLSVAGLPFWVTLRRNCSKRRIAAWVPLPFRLANES
jgi:putative transposase